MADTPQDVVNRELREFKRYTGDGLPGEPVNAPLPVGDPQSGTHNPKKVNLRKALMAPVEAAAQSASDAKDEADRAEEEADRSEGAADRAQNAASAVTSRAWFDYVTTLLTDDNDVIGYVGSGADFEVAAGDIIEAQGFRYEVVASDAVDAHVETAGGVRLLVLQDSRGFLNVLAFGVVGDGVSNDTEALNAALWGGEKTIYVPRGKYYINAPVRLFANTRVICAPDAEFIIETNRGGETGYTFLNGPFGDANYATGYNGDGNISWEGGRMVWTSPEDESIRCQGFGLAHGRNVWIKNVEFVGWVRAHCVELNAMAESGVISCTFLNQVYTPGVDTNREAIQIDHADPGRFSGFGVEDGTACENILIANNFLDGAEAGFGNHAAGSPVHRNIRIIDNTIINCHTFGVQSRHFYDSIISGNYIEGVNGRGIRVYDSPGMIVDGNQVINCGSSPTSAVFFHASDGGIFTKANRVVNNGDVPLFTVAVEIGSSGTPSVGCVVDTDGCDIGASGTVIANNGAGTTINGSKHFSLPDNTAVEYPIPVPPRQGLLAVSTASAASNSIRGLFWVRTVTPGIDVVAMVEVPDVDFTVGPLTGTTGLDGNMTMSVSDGKVYLENRSGGGRNVSLQFLSG